MNRGFVLQFEPLSLNPLPGPVRLAGGTLSPVVLGLLGVLELVQGVVELPRLVRFVAAYLLRGHLAWKDALPPPHELYLPFGPLKLRLGARSVQAGAGRTCTSPQVARGVTRMRTITGK
jgi:hypothetical protein